MPQGFGVGAGQRLPATAAGRGPPWDFLVRWQQGAVVGRVPGLSAAATAGGWRRRPTLDSRTIARRGLGGILGVLAEACGEVGNLLTQGSEVRVEATQKRQESGLGSGRDQIPKLLGNGWLLRHGLVVDENLPPGYVPEREPLPRPMTRSGVPHKLSHSLASYAIALEEPRCGA